MFHRVLVNSKKTSFYSKIFNFRWERVASLDQKRGGCGLVALNNCLYAIGICLNFGIWDFNLIGNCPTPDFMSSHQKVAVQQYTDAQVVTTATNPLRVLRGSTRGRTSKNKSFSKLILQHFFMLTVITDTIKHLRGFFSRTEGRWAEC